MGIAIFDEMGGGTLDRAKRVAQTPQLALSLPLGEARGRLNHCVDKSAAHRPRAVDVHQCRIASIAPMVEK